MNRHIGTRDLKLLQLVSWILSVATPADLSLHSVGEQQQQAQSKNATTELVVNEGKGRISSAHYSFAQAKLKMKHTKWIQFSY